jgi:hypothetical protein
MSTLVLPGTSLAYADFGRWVAMCGHPDRCSAAAELAPFQPGFFCIECGGSTEVIWPQAAMVAGVVRLLMMRPHFKNRNWRPGETLVDLMVENAQHGIFDAVEIPAGQSAFAVTETYVSLDALPDLQALTTGGH